MAHDGAHAMTIRLRILLSRLRAMLTRSRRDRELSEEVQAHLDLLVEEHVRRGMPIAQARAAARRAFGGVEAMEEIYRDQRGVPIVETVGRDLRYGVRALRRNPAFAIVAIASLALGIGVNCAVFTVLNAVLLKELPVAEPDRLVAVGVMRREGRFDFSYPIFRDIASRQQVLAGMAASGGVSLPHVRLEGDPGDRRCGWRDGVGELLFAARRERRVRARVHGGR